MRKSFSISRLCTSSTFAGICSRTQWKIEKNAVLIVITVVQLLVALALILIVLFQSGKSQGLSGAIGGIADSYMSRSKAKSMDAKLARCTKWVAAVFVVLTLVLDCMVAAGIK